MALCQRAQNWPPEGWRHAISSFKAQNNLMTSGQINSKMHTPTLLNVPLEAEPVGDGAIGVVGMLPADATLRTGRVCCAACWDAAVGEAVGEGSMLVSCVLDFRGMMGRTHLLGL